MKVNVFCWLSPILSLALLLCAGVGWAMAADVAGGNAVGQDSRRLPASWRIQPALNSSISPSPDGWKNAVAPSRERHCFWYQQTVEIPRDWAGRRIYLDFDRIEGDAIVFVNDQKAGELLRPGGEMEISSQARTGVENTIRVFITRDYTDISRKFEQDRIRYVSRNNPANKIPMEQWGVGVTGPVKLLSRPRPAGVATVAAQTSWRKKELAFNVEIDAAASCEGLTLVAEVFDNEGEKVLSWTGPSFKTQVGRSTIVLARAWENPRLWELDAGYLYTAKIRLLKDNVALDVVQPFKFGFREIWTDGRKIMLNGHETHWRLAFMHSLAFGDSSPKGMGYARLLGYNAGYIQNHPEMWWRGCSWAAETPLFSQELLDACDQAGFAMMLPAPSVSYLGTSVFEDPMVRKDYEREMDLHLRRYRNHPSVFSWILAMNSTGGISREAINPQQMGQREEKRVSSGQPKAVEVACGIAKAHDPTRLTYSHADGNIGDIGSSCFYLNFAPLQEREEWTSAWSRTGNMPYMMAECGEPFTANFWKEKRFLPTEYFAIYFGDAAYAAETDIGLSKLISYGMMNTGFGAAVNWNNYPAFWDFQRLFIRNSNRAWRISGMNGGWQWWSIDRGKAENISWESMPLITSKPAWANPYFEIERQGNQQLLAYIAGAPSHTDKTHIFYSGEVVAKNVAVAWDGPGKTAIEAVWTLKSSDGTVAGSGKVNAEMSTGEIKQLPFSLPAPPVRKRSDYTLELKTAQDGKPVEGDSFAITVFPRSQPLALRSRIALFDPAGKSAPWLRALGVNATVLTNGDKVDGFDLLIVGREAIAPSDELPYSKEDLRRGLKVLVLEQLPVAWQGLGFRTNETMPRQIFAAGSNSPVLDGLAVSDLSYWRGTPDLLPEGVNQLAESRHAPKWTNTHAVVSSMPQTPRAVGFAPLLVAEFDLDYSPLLEWRYGKGVALFSALDFTGRVGVDPAATQLAKNILTYLDSIVPEQRLRVLYSGGTETAGLLDRLGTDAAPDGNVEDSAGALLVVGADGKAMSQAEIEKFAAAGGRVLLLPQSPERLSAFGLKTTKKELQRVALETNPVFRQIGPSLLRWRDAISVDAFTPADQPKDTSILADGLVAFRTIGKGSLLFCQVSPAILQARYAGDNAKTQAVDTSVIRLEQLLSRLLGNMGAGPSDKIASRLALCLNSGTQYVQLKNWNVLGPYRVDRDDGELMLNTRFSAEDMAIAGETNPNITFPTPEGNVLDWRPTMNPDRNGFVNLGAAYKLESKAVAYAVTLVESSTDRQATLKIGCDWRMKIWVNGKEVFKTLDGQNTANAYQVKVALKKGENKISIKLGSGTRGMGFYAVLSKETKPARTQDLPEMKKVSFYANRPIEDEFDPYFFTYW